MAADTIGNWLMWARENRIAVHRLRIGEVEVECTDLALAEPHRTAAQDDTMPTDDGYPDTIEGRIARDMNLPPPPSARRDEDDD